MIGIWEYTELFYLYARLKFFITKNKLEVYHLDNTEANYENIKKTTTD